VPLSIAGDGGGGKDSNLRYGCRYNPTGGNATLKSLTFERRADKIAVTPDQPTKAHRAEFIECRITGHDVQGVQSEAGAMVGDVGDTTCVDMVLANEERQYVAIDRRAAEVASNIS
jgi:hypothetical protein